MHKLTLKVLCLDFKVNYMSGVHFVSLADNFTAPFSKPLQLPSLMANRKA